ncbi:Secreted chorismate mutase precursor [compost metagenome]
MPPTDPALAKLLDSIERRLAIADTVALHKWYRRQPVQDAAREQAIGESVRLAAPSFQVDPLRAAAFFSDQIEAGKLVQYALLSNWQLKGEAPDTPRRDLQNELRPRLDNLQQVLLEDLSTFLAARPANCAEQLAVALSRRQLDALHSFAMNRATGQLCDKS